MWDAPTSDLCILRILVMILVFRIGHAQTAGLPVDNQPARPHNARGPHVIGANRTRRSERGESTIGCNVAVRVGTALRALLVLCCGLPTCASELTIADAKRLPDYQPVTLSAKAVTYAAAGFFYIQEDSRCIGIRVEKAAHGLTVGQRADVSGDVKTNTDGERYILATSAVHNGDGSLAPVSMINRNLGGGAWHVVGTGGQMGVSGSMGLNTVGSLVRIWGAYQQTGSTAFTVNDGSGPPVECTVPSGTFLYSGWQYVTVTGIVSIYTLDGLTYKLRVLARDIQVAAPVESVSVPGTPTGNASPVVGVSYTYSTAGSTCSQGHPVEHRFYWGDGGSSAWSVSTTASHSWSAQGPQTVTVSARCQTHTSCTATSAGLPINVTSSPYTGELIWIPAGPFTMGTNTPGASDRPQRTVDVPGYYIGRCEVTRGEYRLFKNADGYDNPAYWSTEGWTWRINVGRAAPSYWTAKQTWLGGQSFTQTEEHPVVGVTYYEAEAFCNWAGCHLPTEAQWEKAARWTGSRSNVYPWGDGWDSEACNCKYDTNPAGGGYMRWQTAIVGSYPDGVSPYGVHDMTGNVWEWCQDWFVSYPGNSTPFDYTGSLRVLRGSGWDIDNTSTVYCAYRFGKDPSTSYGYYGGFRVAR